MCRKDNANERQENLFSIARVQFLFCKVSENPRKDRLMDSVSAIKRMFLLCFLHKKANFARMRNIIIKNALGRLMLILITLTAALTVSAQTTDTIQHEVLLKTDMGDIRIKLYNETPKHRDNFLKKVSEGFYDGLLFHRVITSFMIQTGDSASRHAAPGQLLGNSPEPYTIPAEIRFPQLYHKRGAIGAAREGDDVNPERASSSSQFYIVYGRRMNDFMLDQEQQRLDKATNGQVKLTPEIRKAYYERGGTPHLDGQYTVFGEVVEGLKVVDAIQWVETDKNNRPLKDIHIIKATIVK